VFCKVRFTTAPFPFVHKRTALFEPGNPRCLGKKIPRPTNPHLSHEWSVGWARPRGLRSGGGAGLIVFYIFLYLFVSFFIFF